MHPKPEQIFDLRRRHKLTREKLAESLYDIKHERILDWELGRRNCPGLTWWAMCLTWDQRDLWQEENGSI